MGFTATPTDGSATPIPMSSVVPDGTNTPLAVEGGPSKSTGGNTLAPVAVYSYDGYNVTQGALADSAVINPAVSGSVIALLKGLLTELIDIEAQTTLTPTVSGTVTANIGTSGALALETGGNLATLAAAITSSKMQVNVAQVGGQATAMSGSDGQTAANVPMETTGLYNPATPGIERQRTPTVFKVLAEQAVTSGTPVSVWTPATGKKFRIMGYHLSLSVAGAVLIQDSTGVTVLRMPRATNNNPTPSPPMGNGYLSSAANNQVFLDVTATGAVSGVIFGTEE